MRLAGPGGGTLVPGRGVTGWSDDAGAGAGAAGTGVVAAVAGAGVLGRTGAAGAAAAGVERTGPGLGTGGRRVPPGTALRVAAGPGRAGSLPAEEPLFSFSLSRRSTGGSTVDEAERTNSPMSFNIVRTVLLSTPSSLASS